MEVVWFVTACSITEVSALSMFREKHWCPITTLHDNIDWNLHLRENLKTHSGWS